MLSQRSTPVKMSQEAARKLPRWSLLALLTIFAFSGFWATGLWTLRDALSFGTASAMLDGGASAWLMPMMADSPITEAGPLAGWLTAVIIAFGRLTGLMGDIAAVRFAACLLFALTTAALWYGTWHLARRPEAQPIAFAFGGEAGQDQRVYYFNTKEIIGNKYGTPSPIPFRVVDERAGIDIDISIRCFGEYSYRLTDPILFYTNVCGNVEQEYRRDQIDGQLKSELLTALQPAFAKISAMGIRYSALPGHTTEIRDALSEVLSSEWALSRGIEIWKFGVSSVKASEEDEAMLKELQRNAAFMDPTRAAAFMVGSQGDAMKTAAANKGGAAMAFMGMGMAGQMGGINAQNLYAMGQQQAAQCRQPPHAFASGRICRPSSTAWTR